MSEFRRNLLTAMNKAEPPITKDYLTIVALEDGLTAKLSINVCEYCVDGDGNWKSLPADTETESINNGQTLSFRGNLTPTPSAGIGTFTVSKYFNLKGNCMSLLFGDEGKVHFSLEGKNYAFYNLFKGNDKLINAKEFVLPAMTITYACYYSMFNGCENLITTPKLPAIKLAYSCYSRMFQGCFSLAATPKLPANTLADYCYYYMFADCKNLQTISELPAMTLAIACYGYMFEGCISLVNAPELTVTTIANSCCSNMFNGCKNLITAPELPATILLDYCYYAMFNGCSKLNYIKMLATDINATACILNWVNGVASNGTFIKNKDATWNVRGASGIPNGWEVVAE